MATVLYTPDELVQTLHCMFPLMDTIQLHKVMYDNKYNFNNSVNFLVQTILLNTSSSNRAPCILPDDFLRVPGWSVRHSRAKNAEDYMNLMADPVFLREMEAEFGPVHVYHHQITHITSCSTTFNRATRK